MLPPLALDTETCGLHGLPVILQYCTDPSDVKIWNFWKETVADSIKFIEWICQYEGGIVMFNATFDWFHIVKMYNCLRLLEIKDEPPSIAGMAAVESRARDGVVLKPVGCVDIMLVARKGSYQSTMDRSDISIRRVPNALAYPLAGELEKRVPLDPIYFARKADKNAPQWGVYPSRDRETKDEIAGFSDVVLRFAASNALKALAVDALKIPPEDILFFEMVEVDKKLRPKEYGYAPFHEAVDEWGAWPDVIEYHISHWSHNKLAREYARKDAEYTWRLWEYFNRPEMNDHDSALTICVANVRWKGYNVDVGKLKIMRAEAIIEMAKAPRAPEYVKRWLYDAMDDAERLVVHDTQKTTLESVANWIGDCADCGGIGLEKPGVGKCGTCDGTGDGVHLAAVRAKATIAARKAQKEVELYDKIIRAGRFHPSFKVIGALSGRMSGADGLNPQGIKREARVRQCFKLSWDDEVNAGGDFDSFEVVLAAAEYGDEQLIEDLQSGKKIHAIAAMGLYKEGYDEIVASKGTDNDLYTKGKNMVFALIYGGDEGTLERKLGVSLETAEEAYQKFVRKYPKVDAARKKVFLAFCPMRQPQAGGAVYWAEPHDYVSSMFDFRRYFTLENQICKALFQLAEDPPNEWKKFSFTVRRRADRIQKAVGATRSALYGAAFGIQGCNMRAAANHKIQSSGAQITKHTQVGVWNLQPNGIHPWRVRPMNVHDEVQTACDTEETAAEAGRVVSEIVETYRERVPLISMEWDTAYPSWGSAKCKTCGELYDGEHACAKALSRV